MSGPAGAPWLPDDQEAPTGRDRAEETALGIGGSFTFARGASPGQIMAAFGVNPAKARLVPASGAARALPGPGRLRTEPGASVDPGRRSRERGLAPGESTAGYGGYENGAAAEPAAGTEVVLFTRTQAIDDFRHCAGGTMAASFEPLRGPDRDRTGPDRFAGQMRQVGLPADIDDDDDVAPVIALLQMPTIALGIWVPRDLAPGPPLTVQREKAPPRPPL